MGYCISEDEIPEEVREGHFLRDSGSGTLIVEEGECPGVVYAEMRGESFVLVEGEDARNEYERIELDYDQIPRLRAILAFIEDRREKKAPSNRRTS